MPRVARLSVPHCFRHITAKVVSGEFRLAEPAAKREYLRRLCVAVRRFDCVLLSYALMDNHVHFGLEVRATTVSNLLQSLQGPFADWLNKRQGRSGHLWRGRYHEVVGSEPALASHFIRYHHNNPVRAGIATTAADSPWTSHRAYCAMTEPPRELDVARGLALCGMDETTAGRLAFDELTFGQLFEGNCDWMTEEWVALVRSRVRADLQCPVEIGQPVIAVARAPAANELTPQVPVVTASSAGVAHTLAPDVADVVHSVAVRNGSDEHSIRCRGGGRRSQRLRRIVIWAWVRGLGGRPVDVARALNRSDAAIAQVIRRMECSSDDAERTQASEIASTIRESLYFGRLAAKPSER